MDPARWEEIQATFDRLIALEVAERSSQLAALVRVDPELCAAVEAMLAADAGADADLAPLEASLLSSSAATPDLFGFSGRTVAHFHIKEPIGAGGMGVVYRAVDARLDRPVAVKFLLPLYSLDATAKARFAREARAGAALDHPSLCSIHEVGTTDEGQLYLAMPLYRGETLKRRLERDHQLPINEALSIARQIAQGLQAAHGAGIVHRDLKPGNIMLLPDGGVKVLDFGLAKAMDQSVTETAGRFGTAAYMAPEQVRAGAADGRTDLWALGVVLYEMLTGRKPFEGSDEIAVAHAIVHDHPVPVGALRPDVGATLEDVVGRLLQTSPAARYPSADALLGDLDAAAQSGGGRIPSLRDWWRRGRRRAMARSRWISAVAASFIVGIVAYAAPGNGHPAPPAPPRTAIAVLPFQNLSTQGARAFFASGLHEEILTQLYKVPALKVIGRASVMRYRVDSLASLQQVARELGVGTIVQGTVQIAGNRVRVNVQLFDPLADAPLWVQRYDRTLEDAFALESEIAQQIAATVGVVLTSAERHALTDVPTERAQAFILYLRGRELERRPDRTSRENIAGAERLYTQAIALDSGFALAHAALSQIHAWVYLLRYDMTPERLARQRAEAETALRLAPDLPEAHNAMGSVLNVGPHTNPYEALKEWERALRLAPNDTRFIRGTAAFYRQTGNWDAYEQAFQRIVQLDPRDADFLGDYGGDTHQRMGRFADAIHWYERQASITGDSIGFSLAKAWVTLWWKGDFHLVRAWMQGEGGRLARQNDWLYPQIGFWLLEREPDSLLLVLERARQSAFQGSFSFEPVALFAAAAHNLRGDTGAARAAYESALIVADSGIMKYPDDFSVHLARGKALAGLGRRAEAVDEIGKIRQNFLYKDQWVREGMQLGIAEIYAALADAEATVAAVEEMLSQRYTGVTIHLLQLHPNFDRVRDHPRFQALLQKYANHPNLRS